MVKSSMCCQELARIMEKIFQSGEVAGASGEGYGSAVQNWGLGFEWVWCYVCLLWQSGQTWVGDFCQGG